MSDRTPTVFAVDDDPSVLKAMKRLLHSAGFDAEVFASAQAFLDSYPRDVVGCVVLDLAMPGIDGLQLQQRLAEKGGALPIIFLTGHGDVPACARAMKQGAAGFLSKPVEEQELLGAVQEAIRRSTIAHHEQREVTDIQQRLATLTPREREVLAHLMSGKLNKQIAAALGTVEQTIKVHRARIMRKMRATTVVTLVRQAVRAGIASESTESASVH